MPEQKFSPVEMDRIWQLAMVFMYREKNVTVRAAFQDAAVQYADLKKQVQQGVFSVPLGYSMPEHIATFEDDGSLLLKKRPKPAT